MAWRIGVDSGGTFTDVCLFDDATGHVAVWKVSSTPADPSLGIGQGVSIETVTASIAPNLTSPRITPSETSAIVASSRIRP